MVPRLPRSYATLETSKNEAFSRTYLRHGMTTTRRRHDDDATTTRRRQTTRSNERRRYDTQHRNRTQVQAPDPQQSTRTLRNAFGNNTTQCVETLAQKIPKQRSGLHYPPIPTAAIYCRTFADISGAKSERCLPMEQVRPESIRCS